MKVRILVSRVGTNYVQYPGDIVDVKPAEAKRLIKAGHAEKVSKQDLETATVGPTENAATRTKPQTRGK